MKRRAHRPLLTRTAGRGFAPAALVVALFAAAAAGADWPVEGGTPDRAGYTAEELKFPLGPAWVSRELQPPTPAFKDSVVARKQNPRGPATLTSAAREKIAQFARQGLAEPAAYDYAPIPVIAGARVYVGSSTDEALFCFDAATGNRLWAAPADGPVRFAPAVGNGSVYFCADDGAAYALDAATGERRWRQRIAPQAGAAFNNGHLIAAWPVRGGLALAGGKVYCAAGVFPQQGVYLAALDAATGAPAWTQQTAHAIDGPLLVAGDTVWAPTHRTTPYPFDAATGKPRVPKVPVLLSRGAATVWSIDGRPAWGPDEGGLIYFLLSGDTGSAGAKMKRGGQSPLGVVSPLDGWAAVASPGHFVLVQDDRVLAVEIAKFREAIDGRLAALQSGAEPAAEVASFGKLMGSIGDQDQALFDRLQKSAAWTANIPVEAECRSAIIAGGAVILGGKDAVRALDLRSGKELWQAAVAGRARALAAAGGSLYAATDTGAIHCFRNGAGAAKEHRPAVTAVAPDPALAAAAERMVAQAGRGKGVCLVLGGGDGKLAAATAARSAFRVVILEPDPARVEPLRQKLAAAGIYGSQVVVRPEPADGSGLDGYPFGMANLVTSETALATDKIPYPPAKIIRLVQPYGGKLIFGAAQGQPDVAAWRDPQLGGWQPVPAGAGPGGTWLVATRGELPGGGQWPTANGSPGNSMNSGETRVPAAGGELRLQWFGEPFAAEVNDRHSVPMAPLFMGGIAVILGRDNRLIAMDPYNQTILWRAEVPGIARDLASHNASPMTFAADGRRLFAVAGPECWQFDPVSGDRKAALKGVADGCTWGFIGPCGAMLVGTSQGKQDFASIGGRQVSALKDWSASAPAVSRDLFAVDPATGRKLWTFADGAILNPTIAIEGGRIYFAQSKNAAAKSNQLGNMKMGDWIAKDQTGGAEIVALDSATGKPVWRVPITRDLDAPHQWIMYLTAAGDSLLATRTMFKQDGGGIRRGYDFELLDAKTGTGRWTRWVPSEDESTHAGLNYGKNSLSARPIIVGDAFYFRSNFTAKATNGIVLGFGLATGEPLGKPFAAGSHDAGCSVALGSGTALYYRDVQHAVMDLATGKESPLSGATRPACWPNTLPVGGIVFAPEGSAGCSCGLSYQLSFALAPAGR